MLNLESMLPGALFFFVGLIVLWRAWSRKKVIDLLVLKNREELKLVQHQIEAEKRDASIKIKDEIYKRRQELEIDIKRERLELERLQSRLQQKTSDLEHNEAALDKLSDELNMKERELERQKDLIRLAESKVKNLNIELAAKLEKISNMSQAEARKMLQDTLRDEVQHTSQKWITKVEQESRDTAKERSIEMLVTAMQRYTAEQVTLHSSAVIHLPNEEMKGRIIGKEGRNIKALEMATGMEFVIADAPETITISGFNPIRREIARQTLEKLIADGRINSTRIEETVQQVEKELEEVIQEKGKNIILELNLQGVHPELVTLLGKLYFRTSFSQNVLQHSKEVAIFARMIAEELGLDGQIAVRAGLLHDIGKAVTAEVEGPHAMIGADIAKRCGEDLMVVNAIAAHHQEVPFTSVYAPIIVIADTISASRPGARREIFSTYVRRMEKLEEIASSFSGIKKVYALQAGREVRIIVEENVLDDDASLQLARDIAKKIEAEMAFPGQIKINVIREKRSIEYAK
jgi:ribonuclease Y